MTSFEDKFERLLLFRRGAILRAKVDFGSHARNKFLIVVFADDAEIVCMVMTTSHVEWYENNPHETERVIVKPGEIASLAEGTVINCRELHRRSCHWVLDRYRTGRLERHGFLTQELLAELDRTLLASKRLSDAEKCEAVPGYRDVLRERRS